MSFGLLINSIKKLKNTETESDPTTAGTTENVKCDLIPSTLYGQKFSSSSSSSSVSNK